MIDYKKIIKNDKIRYQILNLLQFIPDKEMLCFQYWLKTGRKLTLDNPKRYSEKIQWYKLNYRNPLMPECADKYSVRSYVKDCGLGAILNECYGVYDDVNEIDWEALPNSFVFKDTLGGGGRSIVFVHDKNSIDKKKVSNLIDDWLKIPPNRKNFGREWVYENRKHRIIAEKMLINTQDTDLPDYKFFCFDGKVFCLYMMQNYTMHHEHGVLGFLDRDFRLLSVHRADFSPMTNQPKMPYNYYKMVEIAEILAKEFPHVRVDLYNVSGEIVFGEMTFYNASGYVNFEPDEFDFELGSQFILPIVDY